MQDSDSLGFPALAKGDTAREQTALASASWPSYLVIDLETVYGSLTPFTSYETVKAQSGPFTSRDLLMAVDPSIDHPPMVETPCVCGRKVFIIAEGVEPTCDHCAVPDSLLSMDYGEIDDEIVWTVKEGRRPAFEFFAGYWWRVNPNTAQRTSHRVKNAAKIAELDRTSGRVPRAKKPQPAKTPIRTYVEWEDGSRLPYGETPCWCPSRGRHLSPRAHAESCPTHRDACSVCGDEWDHQD